MTHKTFKCIDCGVIGRTRRGSPVRCSSCSGKHTTEIGFVHKLVRRALDRGELARQPCEVCGGQKAEAHHDDYSKPLVVRWLCRQHHKLYHLSLRSSASDTRAASTERA